MTYEIRLHATTMREQNLNDGRLTVRTSVAAKRKLNEIAKALGVSATRVMEQLIADAPEDLKITVPEDAADKSGALGQGVKKLEQLASQAEQRGKAKIENARKKK